MKKFVIFSIISTLLFSSVAYSQIEFPKTIKGGFKTCTEYNYNFSLKTKMKISFGKFNYNGNLIEKEMYDRDVIYSKEFNKYDSTGNITEVLTLDSNGHINKKQIIKYDNKNNLSETTDIIADSVVFHVNFYYDSLGCLKEIINYKVNSKIDFKITVKNDKNGNWNELIFYTGDDIEIWRKTFTYDSNGNIIEYEMIYAGETSFAEKNTYKYDFFGNMKEVIHYFRSDDPESRTEYIYSR